MTHYPIHTVTRRRESLRSSRKLLGLLGAALLSSLAPAFPQALTTLEYRVTGRQLRVTPASLAVPKGIPGSFLGSVIAGGRELVPEGAYVEATLRGPSFPARRIVGAPGAPILLPPLNLVGDYSLDNIRLVDAQSNATILEGTPGSIPITVFDEVLVARVTSRPLTSEEIQQRGIVIDENNFRAVEFEVGFVVDGKTIPVQFPVVAPAFYGRTEIIPEAELNERLAQAELINESLTVGLPPELEATGLEFEVKGLNIQFVDPGEDDSLALSIPPIAGLVVIPGKIGFLNQFFAVQVFVENAAPVGSGLSVNDVTAELILPPGEDRIPAESYEIPGDDPLRFARVGPDAIIQTVLPVTRAGADGEFGTDDDVPRLQPGQIGQCEFLVEGLREGLHVMDVKLRGTLEGLVAGAVEVEGKAAGSILVRNPNFSLAFSHPRTIRSGEPYTASVTILNTSASPANQVTVTLPEASISGARLESEATVAVGDILPGQTAVAEFQLIAQRTGSITFSNLSSDDDITGRFRLRMGVDERGVPLSPDSIGYPEFVDDLPDDLFAAANRVLGQALSVATAGQLPPSVEEIPNDGAFVTSKSTGRALFRLPPRIVQRRIVELAEAGQRLRYGDSLERVLADLLLDWQGARDHHPGFDQILKVTEAGRQWRETIGTLQQQEQPALGPAGRLAGQAPDLAGRGEAWWAASSDDPTIEPGFVGMDGATVALDFSELDQAGGYRSPDGGTLFLPPQSVGRFEWRAAQPGATGDLTIFLLDSGGAGTLASWAGVALAAGGVAAYDPLGGDFVLQVDAEGDGTFEESVAGALTAITELDPRLIGAVQDVTVHAGRPRFERCTPNPTDLNGKIHNNYGTIVGVLFSKPMDPRSVQMPGSYLLDDGNGAVTVAIQPGGRVALLNLERGVGLTQQRDPVTGEHSLRQRDLTVSGVADPRGGTLVAGAVPVQLTANQGIAIEGRVVRADGTPAFNVPVTLTYYEEAGIFCDLVKIRPSQVRTDQDGRFTFDFVMAGPPYSISATDTGGLSDEAIAIILQGAEDDQVVRDKLLELASQPSVQGTLLEQFAVGALPEAIAKAQGLDRALLKDVVRIGSDRIGSETPVALRFRGRATVRGVVRASDGATPVAGVAVNLFPDPASREKGRGTLTSSDGRFEFFGVPLGIFSLQAQAPDGTTRALSETLTRSGEVREVEVVLSAASIETTSVSGRVFEADGVTPHGGATVLVGEFAGGTIDNTLENIVAVATSDVNGFFGADGVTVGSHDLVAISVDGQRKAIRLDASFTAGNTTVVNLSLQARAIVRGRVEFSDGAPVENAIVAGGLDLVRTDAGGNFVLDGVPTGRRAISAGLERNEAAGIKFPRIGSTRIDVVPGDNNFAVIRFEAKGSITGRVLNQAGEPVPGINVALPLDAGSFAYTRSDENGVYLFENIGLKEWTVSAPAPAASNSQELIEGALDTLGDAAAGEEASQADLLGAITDAYAVFTGVNDPLLTGEGLTFNPISWGFKKVPLTFDGQLANADIVFLPEGTVSGTVVNGQAVPIGARVRLTGIGPTRVGDVGFIIRGERNSDPATGEFEFPGQALAGPFGLQAASPFFPVVVSFNGATNRVNPDASGIVLQFPPTRETNGRLAGTVFHPDGAPVGEDVKVKISFGDLVVRTRADGTFDTQLDLPAGSYSVEADDPVTGLRGQAFVRVQAGITNDVSVTLLAKGNLDIRVTEADGTPVPNANVSVRKVGFPGDEFDLVTEADGSALLGNVFEGFYSVRASAIFGPTTIRGSAGVCAFAGETVEVTVVLQPTGTIRGTFLEDDGLTPVPFAQIVLDGGIGFASTDADGEFEIIGLPLRSYRLIATEPVSGRLGVASASLTTDGQVLNLQVLVRALGEVRGAVLNSARDGLVPGAVVTLAPSDGLTPQRQVTTGPDGRFTFPGTAEGVFVLSALDPLTRLRGSVSGRLNPGVEVLELDVALEARGEITITVFEPDGATPANATVTLTPANLSADTDEQGVVLFGDLPLRTYTLVAQSLDPGRGRSAVKSSITISQPGENAPVSVNLLGVGSVSGTVFESDGLTPAGNATISLRSTSSALGNESRNVVTGADGAYSFTGVAVGTYQVTATFLALAASTSGSIVSDGETDIVDLTLGDNGTVRGRLLRADGVTPVAGLEVGVFFDSQSGLLGVKTDVTDADGGFEMSGVPAGPFQFEGLLPEVNGIARVSSTITANGEVADLADVLLDEDDLRVESVQPSDNALEVSIITDVLITFNEAVDPDSFDSRGIYLCDEVDTVPATLTVEDDGSGVMRVVRLSPNAPLESETIYHLVVIDGDRRSAGGGGISARGPRDLVGRPLVVPFQSTFATEDARPPELLSLTPAEGSIQNDVRSVVRLSFDEALDPAGIFIMLSGPGGPVAGRTALGVNNQVAVFTPDLDLLPNASYTVTASGFRDLAGNAALDQPFTTAFATLDTIGPEIAEIRLKDGVQPAANATVELEVVLATPEAGARVRMTAGFTPIGETTAPGDLDLPFTLPAEGSVTIRAVAIDRFGNEGPFAETLITVAENQPPTVAVELLAPAGGPIATGGEYTFRVTADDDAGVQELRAAITGAAEDPLRVTAGEAILFAGTSRPEAGPGETVTVVASATDSSGVPTGELTFEFEISDGTPPALAITAPEEGTLFNAGDTVTLEVEVSDNFGVSEVQFVASGAFGAVDTAPVPDPAPGSRTMIISVPIPEEVSQDGSPFTLELVAVDAAGNTSPAVARNFAMRDLEPPELVELIPADGASGVSPLTSVVASFGEPLLPSTVVGENVRLFRVSDGAEVPASVGLSADGMVVTLVPDSRLEVRSEYRIEVSSALADLAGNLLAAPIVASFTTSDFRILTPLEGSEFVEGVAAEFTAGGEDLGPIDLVRYSVNGEVLGQAAEPPYPATFAPTAPPGPDDPVSVAVRAEAFATPPNLALGGVATQSTTSFGGDASRAIDGNRDGNWANGSVTHTNNVSNGFWQVDLQSTAEISAVVLYNRSDCCGNRLGNFRLSVLDENEDPVFFQDFPDPVATGGNLRVVMPPATFGRTVRVQLNGLNGEGTGWLSLAEVEVLAPPDDEPVAAAEADYLLHRRTGDADGDGIDNGTEVDNGLDPFRDDAGEDPDGDTLTNAEELVLGTDPFSDDTDGDSIRDDLDDDPLVPRVGLPPVAGVAVLGSALRFDGVDDFVSASLGVSLTQNLTVSVCFENTDDGSGDTGSNYLVSKGPFSGSPNNDIFMNYVAATGEFRFNVVNQAGELFTVRSEPLEPGVYRASGVYDFDAGRLRLFIDGLLVDEVAANGQIKDTNRQLFIGDWQGNGSVNVWHGSVDEVRLWNRVRTQEEIRRDARRRLTGLEPGLVAYWHFDEGAGTIAHDHTNNVADGFLGGGNTDAMPAWVSDALAYHEPPRFVVIQDDAGTALALPGFDPDGDPFTATITALPASGRIYQTPDGVAKGTEITSVPAAVTDDQNRIIYEPNPGFAGPDEWGYFVADRAGEHSAATTAKVHVQPLNQLPTANDDSRDAVQDDITIVTVLDNDSDPDGDALVVAAFHQPANGTVALNQDGTLTYTPDPGFAGTETITYFIADRDRWVRNEDWIDGPAFQSFEGNPAPDRLGFPVWEYAHTRGDAAGTGNPWFRNGRALMLWDDSWLNGGTGVWSQFNDAHADIRQSFFQHNLSSNSDTSFRSVGVVSWINPYGVFDVDVVGDLVITWSGSNGAGSPVDVDVVVARWNAADGSIEELLLQTVSKPTPSDTVNEELAVPVELRNVALQAHDRILVSARGRSQISQRWILMRDHIAILPASTSNTATVTLNVRPNNRPVAVGDPFRLGIGKNGFRWVETDPHDNPVDAITVEMWARSDTETWNANGSLLSKRNAFILYTDMGSKRLRFIVYDSGTTNKQAIFTPDIDLTRWHHYAGTYDGSMVRLFIDGEEVAATPMTGPINLDSDPLFIGRDDGINSNAWFNGQFDEVTIWATSRTPEQIRTDRFTKFTGSEPGLFAHWNFDIAADPIPDLGPNGITAHRMSFPSFVSSPAPFAEAVSTDEDTAVLVDSIGGTDADTDPLTGVVTRLPEFGTLFQTDDGVTPGDPVLFDAGRALLFDGEDDFATIPASVMSGLEDLTVEFFFSPARSGGTHTVLYVRSGNNGFLLQVEGAGPNQRFFYGDEAGTNNFLTMNNLVMEVGQWYHFAVVRKFAEGRLEIFVDGVLRRTLDRSFAAVANAPAQVGARFFVSGNTAFLDGRLDDLRIWNTALDEATINARRSAPLTGSEPNLAAYFPFDSVDRKAILDAGPAGSHGTLASGSAAPDPAAPRRIASTAPLGDLSGIAVTDPERRLIYEPFPDFRGVDEFAFRVSDGLVDSENEATAFIRIESVNDAPTVADDVFSTLSDTPLRTASVLTNDFDTEGNPFSVASVTQPDNGTVVDNGDGTFLYTPNPGFMGEDTFAYTVTDGTNESLAATVTMRVDTFPVVRWINASGGSWQEPANWDPPRVPGPDDKALIDVPGTFTVTVQNTFTQVAALEVRGSATLDIASSVSTTGLTVNGVGRLDPGTNLILRGRLHTGSAGQILVEGPVDWNGGRFSGSGIVTLRDTTTLTSGSSQEVTLRNEGTVHWTGNSSLTFQDATTVINTAGAEWNVPGDRSVFQSGGGNTFRNEGILRKTAGDGAFDLRYDGSFRSTGTIDIQSGRLVFSSPAASITGGSVSLPAGTSLEFFGGFGSVSHVVENTSFISTEGRLLAQSGSGFSVRISDLNEWDGPVEVRGVLVFTEPMTFNSPVVMSGLGSGSFLSLHSSAAFKAGGELSQFQAAGEVTLEGETTLSGFVTAPSTINRGNLAIRSASLRAGVFRNDGTVIQTGTFSPRDGGIVDIINSSGASWEVQGNQTISVNSFLNEGILRRTEGNGDFSVRSLASTGDIEIQTGTLRFNLGNSSITDGTLTFGNGSTLYFDVGSHVVGAGVIVTAPTATLRIDSGASASFQGAVDWGGNITTSFGAGALNFAGPLSNAATVTINSFVNVASATFSGSVTVGTDAGNLRSAGDVIFDGDFAWAGGVLSGAGRKINRGTMTMTGIIRGLETGDLRNEGLAEFNAIRAIPASAGAEIVNAAGAIWDIVKDGAVVSSSDGSGNFVNEGELRKSAGSGEATISRPFVNSGTVRLQSGTLRLDSSATQSAGSIQLEGGNLRTGTLSLSGGLLSGAGTLTGNLTNTGATIRPGSNLGNLTVTGNFTQGAGGVLEMAIAGDVASGEFDTLSIGGTAALGGTLRLFVGAFAATPGETYDLVTYAGGAGGTTFDLEEGLLGQNGIDYTADYLADRFTLTTAPAAVPAPAPGQAPQRLLDPGRSGFDSWLEAGFGPEAHLDDALICGDLADPDRDGLCNLLEYAFGGDPLRPTPMDLRPHPHLQAVDGGLHVSLTYYRRTEAPDLRYVVEASNDLRNWQNQDTAFLETKTVLVSKDFERVTVRWLHPIGMGAPSGFLRIHVTRIPDQNTSVPPVPGPQPEKN